MLEVLSSVRTFLVYFLFNFQGFSPLVSCCLLPLWLHACVTPVFSYLQPPYVFESVCSPLFLDRLFPVSLHAVSQCVVLFRLCFWTFLPFHFWICWYIAPILWFWPWNFASHYNTIDIFKAQLMEVPDVTELSAQTENLSLILLLLPSWPSGPLLLLSDYLTGICGRVRKINKCLSMQPGAPLVYDI